MVQEQSAKKGWQLGNSPSLHLSLFISHSVVDATPGDAATEWNVSLLNQTQPPLWIHAAVMVSSKFLTPDSSFLEV